MSSAESLGKAAAMAAAPEIFVPMEAAEHPASVGGGIIIAVAVVLIIVAIILVSASKKSGPKTAGWMLFVFSLAGLGAGIYLIRRDKGKQ